MTQEITNDGRKNNGGFRAGAGRPKGSGVESSNRTIRIPDDVLKVAEAKGVKLTAAVVRGLKKELGMTEVKELKIKAKK